MDREFDSKIHFLCWMGIGLGTPRERLLSWAVGEDWKSLSLKETAMRFRVRHSIDISKIGIYEGLEIIKEAWEKATGQDFKELRDKYFAEEYSLLDKPK
jgi:hypothetical protein